MLPSRGTASGKSSAALADAEDPLLGKRVRHFQSKGTHDRPRQRQFDGRSILLGFRGGYLRLEHFLADDEFQFMLLEQPSRHVQAKSLQRHITHHIIDRLNDRHVAVADRHLIVQFHAEVLRADGEIGRKLRFAPARPDRTARSMIRSMPPVLPPTDANVAGVARAQFEGGR